MGKRKKEHPLPMSAVRALLEQGLRFADVTKATGYTSRELSLFCKAWAIKVPQGRRPKPVPKGRN